MSDFLERLEEYEREAREVRRSMADRDFINSQPPRLKAALMYYVEKGDLRIAQKISGLDLEDFRELMRMAKVPLT